MEERCNNEQDPISLDDIIEIPETYLYKIKCGPIINCYDIRQLVEWLKTGHNKDPLCGNIIPKEIVEDIYLKYDKIVKKEKKSSSRVYTHPPQNLYRSDLQVPPDYIHNMAYGYDYPIYYSSHNRRMNELQPSYGLENMRRMVEQNNEVDWERINQDIEERREQMQPNRLEFD